MNLEMLLGSALITAIFSGMISYIISRREGRLQYITGERSAWRRQIRKIALKLEGASYEKTLKALCELELRINAFGNDNDKGSYFNDVHIWKIINELEKEEPSEQVLALKQKQLIEYLSLLLKVDWERSKKEVRGKKYNSVSYVIFLCTAIYFIFSYLDGRTLELESFSTMGTYILIVVFLTALIDEILEEKSIAILKVSVDENPQKSKFIKKVACYGWECVRVFLLTIIYISVLCLAFENTENLINMVFLTFLYLIGLGYRFISRTLNIDNEYKYIYAIDKIRNKYERYISGHKSTTIIDVKEENCNGICVKIITTKQKEGRLGMH